MSTASRKAAEKVIREMPQWRREYMQRVSPSERAIELRNEYDLDEDVQDEVLEIFQKDQRARYAERTQRVVKGRIAR